MKFSPTMYRFVNFVVCLASIVVAVRGQNPHVGPVPPDNVTLAEAQRAIYAKPIEMLRRSRSPFDPEILLESDWREKLYPFIGQIPEMQRDRQAATKLKGIYYADTFLLSEQTQLIGDTVLIVREIIPDGEFTSVDIRGNYGFYVFNIGKDETIKKQAKRKPYARLNLDVGPCAIIGLNPIYYGKMACRGHSIVRGAIVR